MKIDIHAHVLPGVDHGAPDWDTCLEMLARSARSGVKAVIATPHYLPWKDRASMASICALCKEAKERLQEKYAISMEIYPGHEIYYSVDIVDILKEGKALTLAESRYVLVEFDEEESFQTLCKAVRDLRYHRYLPIIAHVERYRCLHSLQKMIELKEMGAFIQVNASSVHEGMFSARKRRTRRWLVSGVADFLASDMHDMGPRPPISRDVLRWVQKKLDLEYQEELLYRNAQKIIDDISE